MRGGRQRKRAAKEEKVGNRNGSDPCVDPIYDLVGSLFQKEGGIVSLAFFGERQDGGGRSVDGR